MPPLAAALAIGERQRVSGRQFLEAFLTGFEVECKIAEAIHPSHYKKGFHSSGTVGTFGAAAAAAKLLGLDADKTAHALAIAASTAAGIRVNFGTMTKPLHVGRASQNGVVAAELAARGFTGGKDALDPPVGLLPGVQPRRRLRCRLASSASSATRTRSCGRASRSSRIPAACSAIRRWTRCGGW